mmetsp:Transcript_13339/g.33990  ORF Transcript_13339/g.33990 Transcript_13339/m.33990 type:complete len:354 (+) Transcript_13339:38-1099(+)
MDNLLPPFHAAQERPPVVRDEVLGAPSCTVANRPRRGFKLRLRPKDDPSAKFDDEQLAEKIVSRAVERYEAIFDELIASTGAHSSAVIEASIATAEPGLLWHAFIESKNGDLSGETSRPEPCAEILPDEPLKISSELIKAGFDANGQTLEAQKVPRCQVVNAGRSRRCTYTIFQRKARELASMAVTELPPGRALFGNSDSSSASHGGLLTVVHNPRRPCAVGDEVDGKPWSERVGSGVRSADDDISVQIEFLNQSLTRSVDIYWVDYSGFLVHRQHLRPGQSYREDSFASHPWLIVAGKLMPRTSRNELLIVLQSAALDAGVSTIWGVKDQTLSLMPTFQRGNESPDLHLVVS